MSLTTLSSLGADDSDAVAAQSPGGGGTDLILLAAVVGLLGLGAVMLYSASAVMASKELGGHFELVAQHLIRIAAGLVVMIGAMQVHYQWYRRLVYPILGLAVLGLVLVFVPGVGVTRNAARRWISLGPVDFQPAEFVKFATVVFLAYSVSKKGEKMASFLFGFVPHLLVIGVLVSLLLAQPDFGTSVILVVMMAVMLFASGARILYLSGFGLLGLLGAAYAIVSSPYRMERITAFLEPWKHRQTAGYQVSESLIAIGSGGLTGRGLGDGQGKLGYVPELWNDFIGTIIAEELGFLGMALLVGLFLTFVWRGFRIAFRAEDAFGRYLAFGLTTLIAIQAGGNLFVVTGLVPPKGLTLPFVSYGGSSMMVTMLSAGILLNIAKREPDWWEETRDERERWWRRKRWERKRKNILERREDLR